MVAQGNQAQPVSRSVQVIGDDTITCQTTEIVILNEGAAQNGWQVWQWQVR